MEEDKRGSCKGQLVTTPPTELWLPNLEVRTLKSELSGLDSESLIGGGRRHAEKKSLILGPVGSHPGSVVPPPPYLLGSLVLACQSRTGSLPPILVVSGVFKFCCLLAHKFYFWGLKWFVSVKMNFTQWYLPLINAAF